MPTKPTINLIDEHGLIMLAINILKNIAAKIETVEAVPAADMNVLVGFIQEYADKCHHGKEEEYLFPIMITKPDTSRIVNKLIGEHRLARDLTRGLSEAAREYQPGNPAAFHFARNAQHYAELISHHIRTENEVLFPMADHALTAQEEALLKELFTNFDIKTLGQGRPKEYQEMLKQLQRKYLPVN